jgi:hypothetical protein
MRQFFASGRLLRHVFFAALSLSSLAVIGCSAGGGGVIPDAHPVDAYEVSLDLPPGCPPAAGNEKSVGKPCTPGGNECPNNGTLQCTCDPFLTIRLVGVPCFCTLLTVNSNPDAGDLCAAQSPNACGTNAGCCNVSTIGTYCAPEICLPGGMCPPVNVGQQ